MIPRAPRLVVPALILAAVGLVLITPAPADAYIGPGAGFALLSSFFVFFTTLVAAGFALLMWPIRAALRAVHRLRRGPSDVGRVIIVGFDGQDPQITDALMQDGQLPNFRKLAAGGAYHRLKTTYPAVSPVAWSSFSTGTHPARHNIFDFLDRDRRTYLPRLSSTEITDTSRYLRLGRFRIPLGQPAFRLLRKSKPFWTILGEHGLWSTVLRVPITFPPDHFHGAQLSAMCVPDLTGTQGTFMLYTTRPPAEHIKEGGIRIAVTRRGDRIDAAIPGPDNAFVEGTPPMTCPFTMRVDRQTSSVRVEIGGTVVTLTPRTLSDWIAVKFRPAPFVTVSGLCRMMILEVGDHVSLYVTPINIDPDRPGMPISHPSFYATYLAKRIGRYATLGLAEDTWALNEGVTDEATFLQQTYDIDAERQKMFFAGLDRLRTGALVCVFDATDRIQHMFWRYRDPRHPARRNAPAGAGHRDAIADLYRHNDAFVGAVVKRLRKNDVLLVLSDHGFTSFRRGVNLNGWLRQEGYLALKAGAAGSSQWLRDVDWSATRAYALGLTGLFLNVKGRETGGLVSPGVEADHLKAEIMRKLGGLADTEAGEIAITEAFDPHRLYAGPYLDNAPDLLIGYNAGYRVSWDCANGIVAGPVFEDNTKAWSGDHCVDPRLVPGVLFCSRPLGHLDGTDPSLIDIAPTVLRLFGIEPPGHMDGRVLINLETATSPSRAAAGAVA
jgi:predicted AlkP superfamily phosphohydrolase/phosphomutase